MYTVITILSKPKCFIIMLVISLILIALSAWLPNFQLIRQVMLGHTMNIQEKAVLLISLLGSLQTNFTLISRTFLILSSLLSGVQVALLTYFFRQRVKAVKTVGLSFIGTGLSILGIGCASCGSIVISSLLGLSTMAIVVGVLPLKGQEFSIIGIFTLLFAIKQTVDKINKPEICTI